MKIKNGPDTPNRTGKLVLLISGSATGKTLAARAWVDKSPETRRRTDWSTDARDRLREGYDVALEALTKSMVPRDLYERADQIITNPVTQRIDI